MYKGPIPQRCLALDYEGKSINKDIKHCCDKINNALNNPDSALSYLPKYREYFIPVLYKGRTKGKVDALQGLIYCPWCNKKLPKSTRDKWFEILEKEYQLDDPWDTEQKSLIPKEFETDEWWKKRGL